MKKRSKSILTKSLRDLVEKFFPELRELEDSRIINNIKKAVESYWSDEPLQEILDWLEKQSTLQVRTGIEWVNTIDDACDNRYSEEYAHGEYCHEQSFKWGFQEGVDWLEKQGEKETKGNEREIPISEQKSAWSEEDEKMVECCKIALEFFEKLGKNTPGFPHENYFELNEEKIYPNKINRWLKSLRPQSTWKPSDEQMNALNDVISSRDIRYDVLSELWKNLKKLRED